jgi:hypothetical protein
MYVSTTATPTPFFLPISLLSRKSGRIEYYSLLRPKCIFMDVSRRIHFTISILDWGEYGVHSFHNKYFTISIKKMLSLYARSFEWRSGS